MISGVDDAIERALVIIKKIENNEISIVLPHDIPLFSVAVQIHSELVSAIKSFTKAKMQGLEKYKLNYAQKVVEAYGWLAARNYAKTKPN